MQTEIDQIVAAVKAYDLTKAEWWDKLSGPHDKTVNVEVLEDSIEFSRSTFVGWADVTFDGGETPESLSFAGHFYEGGASIYWGGFSLDDDHPIWDELLAVAPMKVTTVARW